ncbi:MAG: hypothetical protein ACYC4D_08390 [Thermoleophilia bacterium]
MGGFALVGWSVGNLLIAGGYDDKIPMAPNTAIKFILGYQSVLTALAFLAAADAETAMEIFVREEGRSIEVGVTITPEGMLQPIS